MFANEDVLTAAGLLFLGQLMVCFWSQPFISLVSAIIAAIFLYMVYQFIVNRSIIQGKCPTLFSTSGLLGSGLHAR